VRGANSARFRLNLEGSLHWRSVPALPSQVRARTDWLLNREYDGQLPRDGKGGCLSLEGLSVFH
jgi:hypothetical protein